MKSKPLPIAVRSSIVSTARLNDDHDQGLVNSAQWNGDTESMKFNIAVVAALLFVSPLYAAEPAALPQPLLELQARLYKDSFTSYLEDLRAGGDINIGTDPIQSPLFNPDFKRNDWIKSFAAHVAQQKTLTVEAKKALEDKSENMFTSYYHDLGYSRVPYLQPFVASGDPTSPVKSVEKLTLTSRYPGNHTLDVIDYVDERFPKTLQDFVRVNDVSLAIDDSDCDDTFRYQKMQGYTQAARFMGARDNWESQFLFVHNPLKKKYRLAICDIHGEDDKTRILAILGPVFKSGIAEFVRHKKPAPLFNFNEEGRKLKFEDGRRSRVVMGFQNTVWWELKNSGPGWERRSLTTTGAEVSIFENKISEERVISVANVYGDEMTEALETLYAKGARRFVYLGTAGALDPELKLGDLLFPNRFQKPDGKWFDFVNDGVKITVDPPAPARRVLGTAQGWVGTLIHETKDFLLGLKASGVQALDVESRYFADFMMKHKVDEKMVVIVVSDQPMGATNYNNENNTRAVPMKSIVTTLPQIMLSAILNFDKPKHLPASTN